MIAFCLIATDSVVSATKRSKPSFNPGKPS